METHRRGSDGRRRFAPEFKRDLVGRVFRGELTPTDNGE
jgi:transposase-like protein